MKPSSSPALVVERLRHAMRHAMLPLSAAAETISRSLISVGDIFRRIEPALPTESARRKYAHARRVVRREALGPRSRPRRISGRLQPRVNRSTK